MSERVLMAALVDLARASTRDLSVRRILDDFTARLPGVVPIAGASAWLTAPDRKGPLRSATGGVFAELAALELELASGPSLAAHHAGCEVVVERTAGDERFPHWSRAASTAGAAAVVGLPLQCDGTRLGGFTLYATDPIPLSAGDRGNVRMFGDAAAAHLLNARRRSRSRAATQLLRERAFHDPLTGAPNRWLLRDRLAHAVKRSRRAATRVGVLFVDVDGMKTINDRYGHAMGDAFLRVLVDQIRGVLRPEDTLARLAGDEFVVICEELSDVAQAEEVADRMLEAVMVELPIAGSVRARASVSIGIAMAHRGRGAGDDALARADSAMYEAKRAGGGRRHTAAARLAVAPYAIPDTG